MGRVYNNPETGDVFVAADDASLVWSTLRAPVNLLAEGDWLTIEGQEIAFPDFAKFINYGHQRAFNPPPSSNPWAPSFSGDTCQTITMIEPEERVLEEISLGEVPSGISYLDVRINITRTKAPHPYLNDPVPPLVADGEWVHLPGGSCLVEATAIWRRLFEVVLDGNQVKLRRYQSVAPVTDEEESIHFNRGYSGLSGAGQDPWGQSSYTRWGWTFGSSDWQSGTRLGHAAAHIQTKEFSTNPGHGVPGYGGKHIRRTNRCSIDNSAHDFSSTYAGTIVIRPGYIRGANP
ncbi:hypothetical protein [Pelagibacterium montanilacus]|uniref:hypothetical protein n=1 Tax=Pelagibacterium montanilacus TaxID=2185280 RepID=UPI000F8D1957|nr:hypothetical protein [Pelagibacterium montanilacus]